MVNDKDHSSRTFPFKSALNASTLFPYRLGLKEQLRVAAEAGYDGIEIWVRDMEDYLAGGESLDSLRSEIQGSGLEVPNAIAFFRWADNDAAVREEALEQAKNEMEMLAAIGCIAVAAPSFGDVTGASVHKIAERFAALSDLGETTGVTPYLEFWGRAKRLSRLEETIEVLLAADKPNAKLLLDPFHMYTGGSDQETLATLSSERIGIVHANDYGAIPPRDTIADSDRLFPGDGIAPLARMAQLLHAAGYNGYLSLELFMEDFDGLSASEVASLGLRKMKAAFAI
ncbi:sugar phosphate isomerase/epimerase family protein [Paenibacillus sp. LHD-117]|uniref:sugar phosphate isomerase/epimerase family protein n=1 Tax=Paenibacillus sp. LHD-117 TaxID=3071412 RepID=UPI0027E1E6D6|nr:sugar phosphate isomerase/epimerase family protein [Paenibacillus sp. LHD-117]MDQ6418148.1 sugar phosphate isomerase/epimerase family protein [Paenibacillus sp. LHD-117]